jgi:SAM-dependent methyltransferase
MTTWIRNLRARIWTAYVRGRYEVIYLWPGWKDLATFNVGLAPARASVADDPRYRNEATNIEVYASVADALEAGGGIGPGAGLLELGCGRGGGLAYLAERLGCRAVGIDTSRVAVAFARRRGVSARCASSTRLTEADGSVDAAVAVEILLRFREADPTLAELRRVLKPGGRLVVADFKSGGIRQARQQLTRLAAAHGFVVSAFTDRTANARAAMVADEPRRRAVYDRLPSMVRRNMAETLLLAGTRRHAEWLDGRRCYFVGVLTAPAGPEPRQGPGPEAETSRSAAENRA